MKDFAVGLIAWGYIFYFILCMFIASERHMLTPRERVGDTITIMNQQLIITDYDIIDDTYYLHNGAIINRELLLDLKE